MEFSSLKAGDPAYADFGRFGTILVKRGTVTRVTATGRIVVEFEGKSSTFKPNGSGYDLGYLVKLDEFVRRLVVKARRHFNREIAHKIVFAVDRFRGDPDRALLRASLVEAIEALDVAGVSDD